MPPLKLKRNESLQNKIDNVTICRHFRQQDIHVYSCSSLLCTFCFCRVYVSGISSCPVHPAFFFSLNKSVQFSSVQFSYRRETALQVTLVLEKVED